MASKEMPPLDYVRGRLALTPTPLSEIAAAAGVKRSWLYMLARGRIPNPGYRDIMKLVQYFDGAARR
jgi:transcriptional regulator with XRE-family HTH domain